MPYCTIEEAWGPKNPLNPVKASNIDTVYSLYPQKKVQDKDTNPSIESPINGVKTIIKHNPHYQYNSNIKENFD